MVYLKDGQRITGILVSANEDEVRVRIAGISTPLGMDLIEKYEILPPISERYLELRKAVGDDPEQIVQLVKWLRAREKYELALAEINRALAIDRNTPEGKQLKVQLEQQILLKQRAGKGAEDDENSDETPKAQPGKPRTFKRPPDFPLLNDEQINLIKVYEIDLESRPRIMISRETITRLLEQNAGHPLVPITREGRESWYRKDATEILDLMFRLQARNLYPQVRVVDQPHKFDVFRDDVHRTWLLNKCATNECHGGEEAGRLMLYNKRPNSSESLYTNFLILNNYRLSDGTPLINTEEPAKSPLIQIGLPREDSMFPHPPVRNVPGTNGRDIWRPVFTAMDERMVGESVEWIKLLFRPRPDYGINYNPPVGKNAFVPPASNQNSPSPTPQQGNPQPQSPAPSTAPNMPPPAKPAAPSATSGQPTGNPPSPTTPVSPR